MPETLIALRGVSKIHQADEVETQALSEVSFALAAGDYVAVTGPSGCGKSTLLNLLGLLDRPDSGELEFLGQRVVGAREADLTRMRRGNIGFVFQNFNLIEEISVCDNVQLPLKYLGIRAAERHERAMQLLDHVGLTARARHRPSQLSGGQQQRVAVARALVARPRLLLADEPTGNLDSTSGETVYRLLEALPATGTALVAVTHDSRLAARAPRQIAMRDGRIVEQRQDAATASP